MVSLKSIAQSNGFWREKLLEKTKNAAGNMNVSDGKVEERAV